MSKIVSVKAHKIYDSRCNQTVEVVVETTDQLACASAPSGASVGRHEAEAFPFGGVEAALKMTRTMERELYGVEVTEQKEIDEKLHKLIHRIGGSLAIATSIAVAKAASQEKGLWLYEYIAELAKIKPNKKFPLPLSNVIGGGKHSKNGTDIQEFLVFPENAKTPFEAIEKNANAHKEIGNFLSINRSLGKNDEGAWVAGLTTDLALETLQDFAKKSELNMGLDLAASNLWNGNFYVYNRDGKKLNSEEQIDFVEQIVNRYNLSYIEDPLHEEDFSGFEELRKRIGKRCLVAGDDLFVTNKERLEKGVKNRAGNAIIIKPNQVGTLSETIATVKYALAHKYVPIASHRSGETCDTAIVHVAIGLGCPLLKVGISGAERTNKLNELCRLWTNGMKMSNF